MPSHRADTNKKVNSSKGFLELATILPTAKAIKRTLREVWELPTLPLITVKLLQLTRAESSSAQDLVRVIETAPAITAKLLRLVNSAAYGQRHKIASIRQAVVLLGFSAIRAIALEITLFSQLINSKHKKGFDRIHFWRHCLTVANLSLALAKELGHPNPDELYTAGLLHDIGKIVSDVYGRVSYSDIVANLDSHDGLLVEIERKLGGLAHDDLGAYFAAQWGLPEAVVLAIKFHHQRFAHLALAQPAREVIAIVSLANYIAWILGMGSVKTARNFILQPELEELVPLSSLPLPKIIEELNQEMRNIADFYNFSFPTANQFRENLLQANIQLSRVTSKYYYQQDNLESELKLLRQAKRSLTQPHRSLDPRVIIESTLHSIQLDFAYDRLYFFRLDKEKRCLRISDALDGGGRATELLDTSVVIDAAAGGFVDCLRASQPTVLSGESPGEEALLSRFGVAAMGLVPVADNNRTIGLLGIDNHRSQRPILAAELATIAIIGGELGMALENARLFAEAQTLAYRDGLTKLYNRAYLNKMLEQLFAEGQADGEPFTVGMVDVDFFKRFNDTFGHLTGDSILKLLAGTMAKFSRPTDCVGRFGGEEFLFILPKTGLADGIRFGERLRREIESLGLLLVKRFPGRPLTISVGVAAFTPELPALEELVHQADTALYRAKESGRNQVCAATPEPGKG